MALSTTRPLLLPRRPLTIRCTLRSLIPQQQAPNAFLGQPIARPNDSRTLVSVASQRARPTFRPKPEVRITPEEFQELLRDGKATLKDAHSCLYHAYERLSRLDVPARREECRRMRVGTFMVEWLRDYDPELLDPGLSILPGNIKAPLCWLLYGEDGEEAEQAFWEWLSRFEHENENGLERTTRELREQKARPFIGNMMWARVDWSEDGSPDAAIEYYFRLAKIVKIRSGETNLNRRAAWALGKILFDEKCPPADVKLYQQFSEAAPHQERYDSFFRAQLELYHPMEPRVESLLPLVKDESNFDPQNGMWRGRTRTTRVFSRAGYILRLQNRPDEALVLESLLRTYGIEKSSTREVMEKHLKRDPKLERLRTTSA